MVGWDYVHMCVGRGGGIIHTFIMHRGKEEETEIGYRVTWNSTTATLVLLRARSTAPMHRIAILHPHLSDDDDKYNGYIH